jgi:hypothetical protein
MILQHFFLKSVDGDSIGTLLGEFSGIKLTITSKLHSGILVNLIHSLYCFQSEITEHERIFG